jgi:hypothetical protein
MSHPFIKTEQEAAALVVDYLESMGLDIYQEVEMEGVIADLVALRGPEIWIIEVKMSWSLDLLQQLREHRRRLHAHRLFAAVPQSRNGMDRQRLFLDCGFGSITIRNSPDEWAYKTEVTTMAPRVTSRLIPSIRGLLREEHKTFAKAGAPCAAGRFTPFRKTVDALRRIVEAQPGVSIKNALSQMDHHYSSDACARTSLLHWAHAGKVPGVHVVMEGKRITLWPEGMNPTAQPLPEWAQPSLGVA